MALNNFNRRAAGVALAGGLLMLASVGAMAQPLNITGTYTAEGRNPNGTAYTGMAEINENKGNVRINWVVGGMSMQVKGCAKGVS